MGALYYAIFLPRFEVHEPVYSVTIDIIEVRQVLEQKAGWIIVPDHPTDVLLLLGVQIVEVRCSRHVDL
jgi:hypothetical protein